MWSGPRSLSTAMMRAFASRSDTTVVDEPLYAAFLAETGLPHPVARAVLAANDPDWRSVAKVLTGPIPNGKSIFYQKHMTHHLLPSIDREWIFQLTNVFLIREPRRVLASYVKARTVPTLEELGLPQQMELFQEGFRRTGVVPPVIDARDVLIDPKGTLTVLCTALGIDFDEAMLSWEPGPHPEDGVWAAHWYGSVWTSTGFEPYRHVDVELPDELSSLLTACEAIYDQLFSHRLTA